MAIEARILARLKRSRRYAFTCDGHSKDLVCYDEID